MSHEFKIEKLRKMCEDSLEPSIIKENSCLMLRRAQEIRPQVEELKNICLNFIIVNYQQDIQTKSFYDLTKTMIKDINIKVAHDKVSCSLNSLV
jgi:hypothetical protein